MIIFNLMSLVVVGRNVRYFRTSAFLINHTTSLKTLHIFVKKYSVETSQTAAVYEARLAYGKMAAIHQLQNGASATASTINYIFFIIWRTDDVAQRKGDFVIEYDSVIEYKIQGEITKRISFNVYV